MTMNDMLTEFDHFQYSKEHMEMLKLESEINIYESYLESMEFAMTQVGTPLMESGFYFMEKEDVLEGEVVDDGGEDAKNVTPGVKAKMKRVKETLGKKKDQFKNAVVRLLERIQKLFATFVNAMKRALAVVMDKLDKLVHLRIEKMDEEDAKAVVDAVMEAASKTNFRISEKGKEYITKRLGRKVLTQKGEAFQTSVKNMIQGPLNVTVSKDYFPNIVDKNAIQSMFNKGIFGSTSHGGFGITPEKLTTKLNEHRDKLRQNGIDIGVSGGDVDKFIQGYQAIDQILLQILHNAQQKAKVDQMMAGFTNFFTELHLSISDFVKIHNVYINFVRKSVEMIAPIFHAKQNAAV